MTVILSSKQLDNVILVAISNVCVLVTSLSALHYCVDNLNKRVSKSVVFHHPLYFMCFNGC